MAGIAELKAKLAEIENELKTKTDKAYTDLGRIVAKGYTAGATSIQITDEMREIFDELSVDASPRTRTKRASTKSVVSRLIEVFGVEDSKATSMLESFAKAKAKKYLPRISEALDKLESKKQVTAQSACDTISVLFIEIVGAPKEMV